MIISTQLQAWRERKNFTQREAAEHLGVSLRNLQNWEIGHRKPVGLALAALLEKISEPKPSTPLARKKKTRGGRRSAQE